MFRLNSSVFGSLIRLYFSHKIAQLKLLGDFEIEGPDLTEVTITTELVPKSDIGEKKPAVIGNSKIWFEKN
jgi:hypothetical protein